MIYILCLALLFLITSVPASKAGGPRDDYKYQETGSGDFGVEDDWFNKKEVSRKQLDFEREQKKRAAMEADAARKKALMQSTSPKRLPSNTQKSKPKPRPSPTKTELPEKLQKPTTNEVKTEAQEIKRNPEEKERGLNNTVKEYRDVLNKNTNSPEIPPKIEESPQETPQQETSLPYQLPPPGQP